MYDSKAVKEKGILKLEPRQRGPSDGRTVLTPQTSWELTPSSPHPSVDRLSVTWAEPEEMASGVNLFHLPTDTSINNEVKFSPNAAGDGSDDEDYSASLSAVLRQRRASVRRSKKGRARRPSSPFLVDDTRSSRRRSSVFTTSSGDTAISMEESQPTVVTQEQIMENIHLHKEVLGAVKQQPYDMRRKLKIVHQAKSYIKRHEGQLQERLAQSKSTKDIYARFNIVMATKWQQLRREAANLSNVMIPWELRIKEIESHFGSVVASYFTFLRWLFWVNLVIGTILLLFVIVPEYLTANPSQDGERKVILEEERRNATNLLTLWQFEGILKCSPIFYGYYSNIDRPEYKMPLAYFLTGLVVYIYSFVATLRKMAENSRMSKLSEKDDECIFSWKLFTGWDFMIGNAETAHNRIASVILGFKEALLEEAEKKKDLKNWRIISLRVLVNICVVLLLAGSACAVVTVVSRTYDKSKAHGWWQENETTVVITAISTAFPVFFEVLGFFEHYHPRKQLRIQLARIMLLNLLNLYSLIITLFSRIEDMSKELDQLKPSLNDTMNANATMISNNTLELNENLLLNISTNCSEVRVPCMPCELLVHFPLSSMLTTIGLTTLIPSSSISTKQLTIVDTSTLTPETFGKTIIPNSLKHFKAENLVELSTNLVDIDDTTTIKSIDISLQEELLRLREIAGALNNNTNEKEDDKDSSGEIYDVYGEYTYDDTSSVHPSTINMASSIVESTFTDFTKDVTYVSSTASSITEDNSSIDLIFTNDGSNTASSINDTTELVLDSVSSTELNLLSEIDNTSVTYNDVPNETMFTEDKSTTESEITLTVISQSTSVATDTSTITEYTYTHLNDKVASKDPQSTPTIINTSKIANICPNMTLRCQMSCIDVNMTQVFILSNCTVVEKYCLVTKCDIQQKPNFQSNFTRMFETNMTAIDTVYMDEHNRKIYNLTVETKKKLLKLCWETTFGQELVKLTMMDLVMVLLSALFSDFFRSLFVRYMNRCWCWDLEKRFPEYGDFKIAENILHLINNQGVVWMGMFFSPGLVVLNLFKLVIMMYLRSWVVMTCNVPHEVVFRVSKSNNFYLALLLTMLFLYVLPVGYSIVWIKPSWHCGPFSEYDKIYHILTDHIYRVLPSSLNFALEYMASPAIVIPLLVLLILIIYYLISLTNSLREANNDLKIQLRRERTEERRKMFQMVDTRRRTGSSSIDNTPFSRWKKALPSLPLSKSIDSDDRKTISIEKGAEPKTSVKKKGGIFAKIVSLALDRKSEVEEVSENNVSQSPNGDDETDNNFHEILPKEVLKIKDIIIDKDLEVSKKRTNVFFKPIKEGKHKDGLKKGNDKFKVTPIKEIGAANITTLAEVRDKVVVEDKSEEENMFALKEENTVTKQDSNKERMNNEKKMGRKQTSVSSTQSKQSDSIGSVIPVITISTTESDDELLQAQKQPKEAQSKEQKNHGEAKGKREQKRSPELKGLRRQSSVDSNDAAMPKEKHGEDGHKYQYSL